MTATQRRRVAILLGENEASNGKVVAGIADYVKQHLLNWSLLLPVASPSPGTGAGTGADAIAALGKYADAFIVSSDQYDLAALRDKGIPAVGIGLAAPREGDTRHPPMVLADNVALARCAYEYLVSHGAWHYAVYSGPLSCGSLDSDEREQAFIDLACRDRAQVAVYRRDVAEHAMLDAAMEAAIGWIDGLDKPVAIFAADESRARILSQACTLAGYDGDSGVVVVGIDCDALAQDLSPVPLVSVVLNRHELGRSAAVMLQQLLERRLSVSLERVAALELVRPPQNVTTSAYHPLVMRALHYIRHNALRGIKAEQVAYSLRTSRSSLETRFKRALGRSVHDEILRYKLEEAKRMLQSGVTSMNDIAVSCGFTSVQYLYTVFSRELGCTPRVWQDGMLGQSAVAQAA